MKKSNIYVNNSEGPPDALLGRFSGVGSMPSAMCFDAAAENSAGLRLDKGQKA